MSDYDYSDDDADYYEGMDMDEDDDELGNTSMICFMLFYGRSVN